MHEDNELLGEVVVVGYGVQKKSVVTASIAKVSASDLATTAPVRMDNALKGLAAGVTVTSSSGQPGAAAQIRIRGIGTINNSDPLYIVDGMPIEGGLDYVNPSDIESIEVLKDAASGAIYGARAANGVVLVTTKSGKKGKVKVNYNFSYGWQSKWRKRDVLNATEYAVMMNEGYINAGMQPLYSDPYNLTDAMGNPINTGTDWQDELFNDNAPVMNHDVTISGSSDKVNYYLSMGYYEQEGIIGGNFDRSKIGKGMPDWTFGVNFSAAWRGFDFNMMWQGTAGNDVFDATRRIDINSSNLPSWMLNRWTGPGTSNKYPIFIVGDSSDNWKSSDLYVYDGSYLRLKNIELGYTLPENITKTVFINRLRVYVSAENLLTFTKYHGFDPEISSGGTSLGVDYGVYPQARVWRIGFNLEF